MMLPGAPNVKVSEVGRVAQPIGDQISCASVISQL